MVGYYNEGDIAHEFGQIQTLGIQIDAVFAGYICFLSATGSTMALHSSFDTGHVIIDLTR